jgi:hypothetical protein
MDEAEKIFQIDLVLWGGVLLAVLSGGIGAIVEARIVVGVALIVLGLGGIAGLALYVIQSYEVL